MGKWKGKKDVERGVVNQMEEKPQEKECGALFPDTPLQPCPAPPEPVKANQPICSWKMELIRLGTYSDAAAHAPPYCLSASS